MRAFLGLFIAAFISTVSASFGLFPRADGYPDCALGCLAQGANMSKCLSGETSCYCKDPVFVNFTTTCIQKNCTNPADLTQADQTAEDACAAAGAPLASTSTSSAPSSTGTASKKSNSAESIMVNMIGAAAALGLAAFAL
ncbi:hypothetical protein BC827DRAFT_466886 [Russula dissimulans]|nr:hypothetical protein BC827DRAFT_466886 [Russula dissimulans]